MRRALLAALLAAMLVALLVDCYAPAVQLGAPCTPPTGACPDGQACTLVGASYACEPIGASFDAAIADSRDIVDAPRDASFDASDRDSDGDGVPDRVDNCPSVANPDQADEDADGVGDVCDPCPVSTNNTDTDHDGVGDDCDPHPTVAIDHLVLFEGFNHGIPADWTQRDGGWTAGSGDVTGTALGDDLIALFDADIALAGHETVTAGLTIDAISDAANLHSIAVVDDYLNEQGLACEAITNEDLTTELGLVDIGTSAQLKTTAFAMAVADADTLAVRRDGSAFDCTGTRDAGGATTSGSAAGSDAQDDQPAEIALRLHGATATYRWVLVVADDAN